MSKAKRVLPVRPVLDSLEPRLLLSALDPHQDPQALAPAPEAGGGPGNPVGTDGGVTIYSADMDSDPGWSLSGQWQYGQPTGQGGEYGFPDPTGGHTGDNVLGVNLYGDYDTKMGPAYYATTPAIDCSAYSTVELSFWRYLNSDYPPYVNDTIGVSADGANWTTVYRNKSEVEDSSWVYQSYDITAAAAGQSTVYVRWGYQVVSRMGVWSMSGWNIDDVLLRGTVAHPTIQGKVFNDLDVSGTRENGEPGLAGWTVFVDSNGNGTLDDGEPSTLTDGGGNYAFTDLSPGTYTIAQQPQAPWTQTTPAGGTYTVTVNNGDVAECDFGFAGPGVHGTVFEDLNVNAARDSGEPGLGGWTVFADDNLNGVLDDGEFSTTTDANGMYVLELPSGAHFIREQVPSDSGWFQTFPSAGGVWVLDSSFTDSDIVSGRDFGNARNGMIEGQLFNDVNADGSGFPDTVDPGISGWTVYLDLNNNGSLDDGEPSTTSDWFGGYMFWDLAPGQTYTVAEQIPDGWAGTSPTSGAQSVFVGSGQEAWADFGNAEYGVHGRVWSDDDGNGSQSEFEAGMEGWTVYADLNNNGQLDDGEPFTNANGVGDYALTLPDAGTYTVRAELPPMWVQTVPTSGSYTVTYNGAEVIAGNNFGLYQGASISGSVYEDVNANAMRDEGEGGLAGWTVYLDLDQSGTLDAGEPATTTDSTGQYQFDNLLPGFYMVTEVTPDGWTQTTGSSWGVEVGPGDEVAGLDFGDFKSSSISGQVFQDDNGNGVRDPGEVGLDDWFVEVSGQNLGWWNDTQTYSQDLNGDGIIDPQTESGLYSFSDVSADTYTVSEDQPDGWNITLPAEGSYSVDVPYGETITGLDFGNQPIRGDVTGYEWSDLNGDGVREPGEPVLGGMTVELWQPSKGGPEAQSPQPASQAPGDGTLVATTTTDENGYYHFDALMPGQYYVTFVKPSGTIWTWTNAGTDPALDSDVDPEISDQGAGPDQGRTDTFNVPLDDSADTVSAGVTEPAEVSGYLWYDANNNGLWDAGESPLANFLISFSGENNAAYGGVMTDENGYYDMVLPAGQCEVYQDLPWMMVQTSPLFSCTGGPGTGYQLDNAAGTVSENNNFALTQGGIVGCTLYQSQLSPKVWATVYGDLNDNGQLDPNEPSTTVWANGWEYYTRMPVGTWTLRSQSAGSYWISPSSTTITVYPGSYSYATFYATTQPSNLSGRVWRDANADGSIGTDESGLSGWSVFLDDNDNGQLDSGEATATTDADGNYTFVNVPPGWHTIREVLPGGYVQTSPGLGYYSTYVWPGQSTGDLNFGNQRTAPTGDFNNDGNVDAADIDLLYAHYGAANADTYDLDGDANVTQSDMDYLIHTIKNTWYGDANLDGKVGFGDFQALLDNWHATGTGWACGDFDGNGTTEYHDFQLLLDNWNPMGVHSPVTSGDSASSAATALATAAATAAPADTTVSVAAATTTAPLTVTPKAVTAMAAARPARTMNVLAGDALPTDLLAAPAARIAIPSTVRTPAAPAVRFGLGGFAPAASAQKFLAQVKLPRHHKALSVSVLNADDNTAPAGSVVRSVLERIV